MAVLMLSDVPIPLLQLLTRLVAWPVVLHDLTAVCAVARAAWTVASAAAKAEAEAWEAAWAVAWEVRIATYGRDLMEFMCERYGGR